MSSRQLLRLPLAATCARKISIRSISSTTRLLEAKPHPNVDGHRETQSKKPLGPHMTNTTSTIANEMPSVGADKAPPELLTSVDPDFAPKDANPKNTERMTGGTQKQSSTQAEDLSVGQMSESEFKIDPLRREGEDANTIHQSRKRGTLESDLLLSTFADANLAKMNMNQLRQYDLFLDENDWDIYYWATQEPSPTSLETAEGSSPNYATPAAQGKKASSESSGGSVPLAWAKDGQSQSGEWAQTVGTFKPAYRPVPARWKNSEVLAMLRRHVLERSAGGVHAGEDVVAPANEEGKGGGLGRMPEVKNFDI